MQRKSTHCFRKSFTAALAGAAGLTMGMHIATNQAAAETEPPSSLERAGYAGGAFVPFVAAPLFVPFATHNVDPTRECEAGIDSDCIYL